MRGVKAADEGAGDWPPLTSSYTAAAGALATRLTMRYQTLSHEELQKARREQWDNERCGETISNAARLVLPKVGQCREWPEARLDGFMSLAAAPTFAIMAFLAGVQDGGMPGMLCLAAHGASLLTGMVPMYLLMGAIHSTPWLRLIANWRRGAYQV
jgi:hypothetical protein